MDHWTEQRAQDQVSYIGIGESRVGIADQQGRMEQAIIGAGTIGLKTQNWKIVLGSYLILIYP